MLSQEIEKKQIISGTETRALEDHILSVRNTVHSTNKRNCDIGKARKRVPFVCEHRKLPEFKPSLTESLPSINGERVQQCR